MGLFDMLFAFDVWYLENTDAIPPLRLQGQFVAINPTETISNRYAQHNALNRAKPIIQFLNGEADRVSFQVRLRARDALFSSVEDNLNMLKSWARRDDALKRPPILSFWIADGHLSLSKCVIESLSGITYGKPTSLGAIQDVTLTINLLEYDPYSLEEVGAFETRYHRAKIRDYYEMLAYREYRNPLLGDVIRKRHPDKQKIKVAEVIKLPSVEAIRKEVIEPKSIPFSTAYGKKETPQRTLRLQMFERTNRTHVSHVLKQ